MNADLIAAGLSPFTPELAAVRAGRIMLEQIHEHVRKGDGFAFAGNGDRARAPARRGGWSLVSPEDVIRRRFDAGLRNFSQIYKPLVDEWVLYDNSGDEPVRLDEGHKS